MKHSRISVQKIRTFSVAHDGTFDGFASLRRLRETVAVEGTGAFCMPVTVACVMGGATFRERLDCQEGNKILLSVVILHDHDGCVQQVQREDLECQEGDRIISVDGVSVSSIEELRVAIMDKEEVGAS